MHIHAGVDSADLGGSTVCEGILEIKPSKQQESRSRPTA